MVALDDPATGQPNLNDPSTWAELRTAPLFLIDLQARYDLGAAIHSAQKMEMVLMVVNALNNYDATSYADRYSKSSSNRFGMILGRMSPLQAQLTLRVRN